MSSSGSAQQTNSDASLARMSSSPSEGMRNGDEDGASPFGIVHPLSKETPWGKDFTLAFSVPALLFAGECVMKHLVFRQ